MRAQKAFNILNYINFCVKIDNILENEVQTMIAIIDYGAGNLHSVKNALDYLGVKSIITSNSDDILSASHVILPGVGSFGDAMRCLKDSNLIDTVKKAADGSRPFLGICLGLHLLFEESEESPDAEGLGIYKGKVKKIPDTGLKIPHMGWNNIELSKQSRILPDNSPYMYFVHSYYIEPQDKSLISSYTEYGKKLAVSIEDNNVFAVQFHPEKSGAVGLGILKKFSEL